MDFYDELAEKGFVMMKKDYPIFLFDFFKLFLINSIQQNGTGFKIK